MATLREMRDHVGIDPDEVLRHPERYNRADRRLAKRVVQERESRIRDDIAEGLRQSAAGEVVGLGSFAEYVDPKDDEPEGVSS